MRIENIETFLVRIPFRSGGRSGNWAGKDWATMDYALVRIDTSAGISGWGDGFGFGNAAWATKAAVERMLKPRLIGRDARDIAGISRALQMENHIWGRYGITMFAISGVDIALWDIAGKAAGLPVHRLLGGPGRLGLKAYASLFKYQDTEVVAEKTKQAWEMGYRHVKLHETTVPETRAAREAAPEIAIMLDTNCPWTPVEARAMAERLKPYGLHWLEEPIYPPEDFAALAKLQRESGIPVAAGENACTAFQFREMLAAGAVTYCQPSVTKVGGISEFRKVAVLAEQQGVQLVPHSPYFGTGFLATLHLLAALETETLIEHIFLDSEASLFGDWTKPKDAVFRVPEGPGLGCDPDMAVVRAYLAKDD